MARIAEAVTCHRAGVMGVGRLRSFLRWVGVIFADFAIVMRRMGAEGIADKRLGRALARWAPVDEEAWVVEMFQTPGRCRRALRIFKGLVSDRRRENVSESGALGALP